MKEAEHYRRANVGIQTIIAPRNYIPPIVAASHQLPLLDYPKFLYKPHTVFFLVLTLAITIYFAFSPVEADIPFVNSLRRCAVAGALVFVVYAAVYFPDTAMNKPHPVFWRVVQGCACIYLMFVVFVLFLDLDTARQILKYLDPRLGVPLPEKAYGVDCRLYTPENPNSKFANFMDAMDIYIMCHWFGWWFKMLIFRDVPMCIYMGAVFEGLERTFKHWLPNFDECWWDSLILDFLGCNMIGIILGYFTCKYLEMGSFRWFGTTQRGTYVNEMTKIFDMFHPNTWSHYNWRMFESLPNFLGVIWLIVVNSVTDSNNFFLKYVLWIPANHWTLMARVLLMGFLALASIKEYYLFITNKEYRRFSSSMWLTNFIFLAELGIWLKFAPQVFTAPFPEHVVVVWALVGVAFVLTMIVLFIRDMMKRGNPKKELKPFNPYNPSVDIEYVK